jgi:hypothetical protein
LFAQIGVEPVEPVFPSAALLTNPTLGSSESAWLKAAGTDPTALLGPDKIAVLKDLHVMHDRGQGHVERLGQFAHRGRACDEALDHAPPSSVSQCLKDAIQLGPMVNHFIKYTWSGEKVK